MYDVTNMTGQIHYPLLPVVVPNALGAISCGPQNGWGARFAAPVGVWPVCREVTELDQQIKFYKIFTYVPLRFIRNVNPSWRPDWIHWRNEPGRNNLAAGFVEIMHHNMDFLGSLRPQAF